MRLSYRARRAWSVVVLLVGLPIYVVLAVNLVDWLRPMPVLLELVLFVVLGIAWALPLRFVFRGVGREDPDAAKPPDRRPPG